jgi:hypothetical protein
MAQRPKKLLGQVRDALRLKHYSIRTETSYVAWTKRYFLFHNTQDPLDLGSAEIEAFLTHLAVNDKVAASTQNQAFSALHFLYREDSGRIWNFPLILSAPKNRNGCPPS